MKNLFAKHEIQFIAWFCGMFIVSVVFLAMLGLLPSEFLPGGGRTFEQVTRDAVREIVEGRPLDPSRNTNIAANSSQNNQNSVINTVANSGTNSNTSTNSNWTNANMGTGSIGPTNISSQISTASQIKTTTGVTMYAEEPTRLVIPSISVDTVISNPKSTSFEVLDAALTKSAVRYPGSGLPGIGNMFIFGHSTGFSVVQNQAYKVFNKLKNVKVGAMVTVYSKSAVYEYRVSNVKLVDKSKQLVEFDTQNNMLTLSTCDSFGRDQDRYVVEADLVSVRKNS
jgi:LPXTG-site transpeptidase (sortase) family protein